MTHPVNVRIQIIGKHIGDVEALGDIGAVNLDAISKILAKQRGLYVCIVSPLLYTG